ncbi:MAG: hypothetical protein OEQ53_08930 [Saprospiraceae bacterium]|nr:hypothetical protein [Saprospiraceae bacterium]
MKLSTITIVLASLVQVYSTDLIAQEDDPSSLILVQLHYGIQTPGADLANRFGTNFNLGGNIAFLSPSNLFLSLTYNFLFGSNVKEDVLSPIRTVEGLIIGQDQQFANLFMRERGQYAAGIAGTLLPINRDRNASSGILLAAGIGVLKHKIRFVDDFDSVAPLFHPYSKGYDRLTSGLALVQHVGYLHLGKDAMLNFFAGFDLVQGFTKNRRGYNYDQGAFDDANRTDLLVGFRLGWIFPLLLGERTIYY